MPAAGRAGSALSVRQQRCSDAPRLVSLSDEQEAEVSRAIERPRRDDPCETERLAAFERDEELVAFPQPFKEARPRAAKRHAIALKER